MNSSLTTTMSGQEIVDLIVALEKDERIVDKMPAFASTIKDFAYSVNEFPDHIRRTIGDRITANGVDEASAIRRAIMASDHGHASISFYLESVETILRINSYRQQSRYTPAVQVAQSIIASIVDEMGMGDLDGDELEPRHHQIIVAAYLLNQIDVNSHNFRFPHDYHVAVETMRENLDALMKNLDVLLVQDYKLVPTNSVAGLAVCIATHPEIDPQRIFHAVLERGSFVPELMDAMMETNAVPLDRGVL
jgi:hypothetical protein